MVTILTTLYTVHARLHKSAIVERDISARDFESGVTEILRVVKQNTSINPDPTSSHQVH
jgi:hypothetical protein